jgi:hypothetical protein
MSLSYESDLKSLTVKLLILFFAVELLAVTVKHFL